MESQCDGLCNPWVDIPEIKITFQDGEEDRAVFTEHYNPFNTTRSCNYLGHLEKEKDTSTIAITGCADKENVDGRMDITLFSKRWNGIGEIILDFDDNNFSKLYGWLQ